MSQPTDADRAAELVASYRKLRDELAKAIVGQEAVVDQLVTAMFAGGHCLLEGVPGLAKTLLVQDAWPRRWTCRSAASSSRPT